MAVLWLPCNTMDWSALCESMADCSLEMLPSWLKAEESDDWLTPTSWYAPSSEGRPLLAVAAVPPLPAAC